MTAFEGLRLPVVAAPMFLISGPDLVVAAVVSRLAEEYQAAADRLCRRVRA